MRGDRVYHTNGCHSYEFPRVSVPEKVSRNCSPNRLWCRQSLWNMESECLSYHCPSESADPAIRLPEVRRDPRAFAAQDRLAAEADAPPKRPHLLANQQPAFSRLRDR
jgi:hypothetical protein